MWPTRQCPRVGFPQGRRSAYRWLLRDNGAVANGVGTVMASRPEPSLDTLGEPLFDDSIRCRRCRTVVTHGEQAVERGGAHERTFRNPEGYSFTIRCFQDALGCFASGGLTAEATWFAGYQWCFAQCKGCEDHIGWWYVGSGPSFVALIATRLD